MNYKKLLTFLSLAALSSCEEKQIIEGKRENVFAYASSLKPDISQEKENVDLLPIQNPSAWELHHYGTHNVLPHVDYGGDFKLTQTYRCGEGEGRGKHLLYSPLVVKNTLFTADTSGVVRAFDTNKQALLWAQPIVKQENIPQTSLAAISFYKDKIYAVASQKKAVALNASTGKIERTYPLSGIGRIPPIAKNNILYISNIEGSIEAFNTQTGARNWFYHSNEEEAFLLGGSPVATGQNTLIAPLISGEVVALGPTGQPLWQDQISSEDQGNILSGIHHIYAPVVIHEGKAYVQSHSGLLVCYNIKSGGRIWEQPILGLQAPVLTKDHIIVLDKNAQLICLNKGSGQVKWVKKHPTTIDEYAKNQPIYWFGPLAVSHHIMICNSRGEVHMIDPNTGILKKKTQLDHAIALRPFVVNKKMYITSPNNTVYVYE